MARVEKKKQKMFDAAYTHLEWAEAAMFDSGQVPSDVNLTLVNTRVALAHAWIDLGRETGP